MQGCRAGTSRTSPSPGERPSEVLDVRPLRSSLTASMAGLAASMGSKLRAPRAGALAARNSPTLPLRVGATLPLRVGADCPGTAVGKPRSGMRRHEGHGGEGVGQGTTDCGGPEVAPASFPSPLPGLCIPDTKTSTPRETETSGQGAMERNGPWSFAGLRPDAPSRPGGGGAHARPGYDGLRWP